MAAGVAVCVQNRVALAIKGGGGVASRACLGERVILVWCVDGLASSCAACALRYAVCFQFSESVVGPCLVSKSEKFSVL